MFNDDIISWIHRREVTNNNACRKLGEKQHTNIFNYRYLNDKIVVYIAIYNSM